jgi:hypothetical protein
MRWIATATALASLALLAAPAVAKSPAVLTVDPNAAGAGTRATLDLTPPDPDRNPRAIVLRVVKGAKIDPRARKVKCKRAQANDEACPAKSRIGGGKADVTVTSAVFPAQHVQVDVDLFLMPPQRDGDRAGIAAQFEVSQTGQKGHAIGRVYRIDIGRFGLETRFDGLDTALKPPQGFKAHVDHLRLSFGAHRTITKRKPNGEKVKVRVDLLRNPRTCDGSWPYKVTFEWAGRAPYGAHGSTACTD